MDPSELIGRVLKDTYRIDKIIGKGGMGAVYRASHTRLDRHFAVKVFFAANAEQGDALARFRREARVTSALGHPHIVAVVDTDRTDDDVDFIIMEFLNGEELGARLEHQGRLSLATTATIFEETASALAVAHDTGVIHRDLKPQNIFLCRRDERDDFVKVLDFGISKVLGSQSVRTKTRLVLGSPAYMSAGAAPRPARKPPPSASQPGPVRATASTDTSPVTAEIRPIPLRAVESDAGAAAASPEASMSPPASIGTPPARVRRRRGRKKKKRAARKPGQKQPSSPGPGRPGKDHLGEGIEADW